MIPALVPVILGLSRASRRVVWTPEKLVQPGDSWLWADLDAAGAVERNTQPAIVNTGFDDVSGWSFTGAGWAIGGGVATHTPGSAGSVIQNALVIGNRYTYGWQIQTITDGTITPYVGIGAPQTAKSAAGSYSVEATCSVDTYVYFLASAASDAVIDNCATNATNLSVKTVTCKGNLGNLTQATAANMPWDSDVDAPTSVLVNGKRVVYSDGAADHCVSSGAASTHPYHKAAGFTYVEVVRPDTAAAGTDTLVDSCNATGTNVGITVEYDATNQQVVVKVANADGGGTFVVNQASGAGTVPKAGWTRVAVSWSQAAGVIIRTDENAPVTAASVGAASAADATATLQYGRTSGGANFYFGGRAGMLIKTGAATSDQLGQWLEWAKTEYAL